MNGPATQAPEQLSVAEKACMPSREKYWEECSAEQKLDRLRDAVARLCREVSTQADAIRCLAAHSHGENGLLIPIHFADRSTNLAGGSMGGTFAHDNGIPHNLRTERERR